MADGRIESDNPAMIVLNGREVEPRLNTTKFFVRLKVVLMPRN